MDWQNNVFTVSNLINIVVVMVAYSIKSELRHIRESIDTAKDYAKDAKMTALKAHDRLDFLIEHGVRK
jgi:hypothetical protein